MEALVRELAEKIIRELGLDDIDIQTVNQDTPFFDNGLEIDSVDILELVVLLDRDYQVTIDSREVGERIFVTLGTLAAYVKENRAA